MLSDVAIHQSLPACKSVFEHLVDLPLNNTRPGSWHTLRLLLCFSAKHSVVWSDFKILVYFQRLSLPVCVFIRDRNHYFAGNDPRRLFMTHVSILYLVIIYKLPYLGGSRNIPTLLACNAMKCFLSVPVFVSRDYSSMTRVPAFPVRVSVVEFRSQITGKTSPVLGLRGWMQHAFHCPNSTAIGDPNLYFRPHRPRPRSFFGKKRVILFNMHRGGFKF